MKFHINMLLAADHFNHNESTAVCTADYYRIHKNDLNVNYTQVIIYGKKNKKLKEELGGMCFVDTPMQLFKKCNHRVVWILCEELFFHLNRWIGSVHTDSEDIEDYMKHGREKRPCIFSKYAWTRGPSFRVLEEPYIKGSLSLSGQEKEKISLLVKNCIGKICNPETKRNLEGLAMQVSRSTSRKTGNRKYTVKLTEYPKPRIKATCRFETDPYEKPLSSSLEIFYG